MPRQFVLLGSLLLALSACNKPEPAVTKEPIVTPAPLPPQAPVATKSFLQIGAPIDATVEVVSLAKIAKTPGAYKDKTIATNGTVTAVCQNMGCWMEIKDDASQAHIKMAGHNFFVPKTAAGHKAKVLAKVVASDDENAECNEEAAKQMGKPVAKIQLEAMGVELD